jgi:hypothetical protein
MRKSPQKKTPEKGKLMSTNRSNQSSAQANSTVSIYFCHYKNAMYMGGIKSFKKEGRGILLHDNGTSVISSYYNDLLHGHNIFFMQHCLLSA